MSNDPWEVQPQEAKVYFAQSQIVRTEKHGQSGNTFFEMEIWLTPIEPGKEVVNRKFFNFNPAWEKITIPSVMKLVQDKKIAQPVEMEKQQQFVSYRWSEYRNYAGKDIAYWQTKDATKLGVDEQGRTFKPVMGLEFMDVFPTEEAWRKAYEAVNPQLEEMPELPYDNGATVDPAVEAAKTALVAIVQSCGTNMAQLQERLVHPPLNVFNINSVEVRDAVAAFVAYRAGQDKTKQEQYLGEVNSYFTAETPYLTLESPELASKLAEIAF